MTASGGAAYIFHHVTAFTFPSGEFPVKSELRREDSRGTWWVNNPTNKHSQTHKATDKQRGNLSRISTFVGGGGGWMSGAVWSH